MLFGQENVMTVEYEILKENHETLMKDYESLQQSIRHTEETYEAIKLHLQNKAKALEESNRRLLEECVRERSEKEKFKKTFEEMKKTMESERNVITDKLMSKKQELEESNKRLLEECVRERSEKEKFKKTFEEMKKTMESERNAIADELMSKSQELSLARRKVEEVVEKIEGRYFQLAEKYDVVEAECAYLKSLYDAEVVASGTQSAVMSGIGETDNLIGQGENEVNHVANNAGTDAIMISDESDAEHDNSPTPRESNISSHQSVERNQEEECRNRGNASNENRALGEIFTPRSASNPPPFSPSSSSSSSSSSSDGYEVVFKLPPIWPEWATPKGPGNSSNKS